MPIMDKHEHGRFSWAELVTPDQAAAKTFYGSLFGWTFEDMKSGPNMVYTMCRLNGQTASALYSKGGGAQEPPTWLSFITVTSADEAAAGVTASGGQVLTPPFDVANAGRMAVAADPTGAMFALWQPRTHIGAQIVYEPGALRWNELVTNDLEQAGQFYVQAIGWTIELVDMGVKGTYTLFNSAIEQENTAGMMPAPPPLDAAPPHWLPYFSVEDVDAASQTVNTLGGKTLQEPVDIPVGRFALVQDPLGATFGIFKDPF